MSRQSIKRLMFGASMCLTIVGCGLDHASTIGQFAPQANFPMYYTTGGETDGDGAIYKVAEVTVGKSTTSTLLVSGLTSPRGLVQDSTGALYFAENGTSPDGRIQRVAPGAKAAHDYAVSLEYPTGVSVDTFNQVYVLENGRSRVIKISSTGSVSTFKGSEIGPPEASTMDLKDNLYLVESDTNVISRITPDGNRTVVSPELFDVVGIAMESRGHLFVLSGTSDENSGSVLRVVDKNKTEPVLSNLTNPTALAIDESGSLYVAEGAPNNRIIRYSMETKTASVILTPESAPTSITFTPF